MRYKIDWASLIVGSKFSYLRAIFQVLTAGGLYLEGLIFGILRYLCNFNSADHEVHNHDF